MNDQLKQCSCHLLWLMGQEDPFQDLQGIGPFVTPLANDAYEMEIWSGDENSDINGGVNAIDLAKASHGFFHHNGHTLQKQFQLVPTEGPDIINSCDNCHVLAAPLLAGVNLRGLWALELWQTDVTQVAEFGRFKYVPVTVDTFSSAVWASAHMGEKTHNVIARWRQALANPGIPSAVKTHNGPAYALQKVQQFLQLWGVSHKFGIPHSPTGQTIVERTHGTLKWVLQKQKWGMQGVTLHSQLAKALYTFNHLTVQLNSNNPVMLNHHLLLQALDEMNQP
ncbi:hypothetical protein HGM15179_021466 [Zosterops borbonicus]|uniref:RNA-directed DNA polymerase n=1 Tax=Zosterops borbonicus TaxID=364589 RepID=A0A8K1D4E4_9PASS|nr:hypothetical protein HGM15179_021466 [Zosterops borbonicus]